MEHIRAIQELVDAQKEAMPTGVVTDVMEQCQKAYEALPKLYQLTWTTVTSHAHVEHAVEDEGHFVQVTLSHQTQTLIVEAVDELADHPQPFLNPRTVSRTRKLCAGDMPHHGMVLKSWLTLAMPRVHECGVSDSMIVIHSIVPYEPHKRPREA